MSLNTEETKPTTEPVTESKPVPVAPMEVVESKGPETKSDESAANLKRAAENKTEIEENSTEPTPKVAKVETDEPKTGEKRGLKEEKKDEESKPAVESEKKDSSDTEKPVNSTVTTTDDKTQNQTNTKGKGKGKGKGKSNNGTNPYVHQGPVTPEVIKTQVEYYLSIENLQHDSFFHGILKAASPEMWMSKDTLLNCKKLASMVSSYGDDAWPKVIEALKDSSVVEVGSPKEDGKNDHVRRKDKTLPELKPRQKENKWGNGYNGTGGSVKKTFENCTSTNELSESFFKGGAILRFSPISNPDRVTYGCIKQSFNEHFRENPIESIRNSTLGCKQPNSVWASNMKIEAKGKIGIKQSEKEVDDMKEEEKETALYLCVSAFNNDIEFWREFCKKSFPVKVPKVDNEDEKDTIEVTVSLLETEPDLKNVCLNVLSQDARERRQRIATMHSRNLRLRKIKIGSQLFDNMMALKKRVSNIKETHDHDEPFPKEGSDHKLINDLLDFHPKGAKKKENMKHFCIGKSTYGDDNICFWVVKEDGTKEDFSVVKIYNVLENSNDAIVVVQNPGKGKGKGKK